MAVLKDDISYVHWQLAAAQTEPEGGDIVTGYDDIHECIRRLVLTPIGSVPSNPAKGCDLLPGIDRPPEIGIPLICQAVWDAITAWEPRVEVGTVKAEAKSTAHFVVTAPWRVKGSVAAQIQQTDIIIPRASDAKGATA